MAMSHPYIRISLISDGKTLLKTNGSGKTNEVMSEIYGIKVAKDLVHIQGDTSDYHLEGFVLSQNTQEVINIIFQFLSMDDILRILYLIKLLLKGIIHY